MAVPTIDITGQVVLPDGSYMPGGEILARLMCFGHVADGGTEQIVGGVRRFVVADDGSVDGMALVPNDLITPFNGGPNTYKLTFRLPDGTTWALFATVDSTGADPLDIGDLTVVGEINGVPVPLLDAIPDVVITSPSDDEVLVYNAATGKWENGPQTGGGGGGSLTSLSDTDLASLADVDYLIYDSGAAKWKNVQLKLRQFTDAGKPAANASNVGRIFRVKDGSVAGRVESIDETSGGSYVYIVLGSAE